jgi:hypothetical protein
MDKVQKTSGSEYHISSSEPFKSQKSMFSIHCCQYYYLYQIMYTFSRRREIYRNGNTNEVLLKLTHVYLVLTGSIILSDLAHKAKF